MRLWPSPRLRSAVAVVALIAAPLAHASRAFAQDDSIESRAARMTSEILRDLPALLELEAMGGDVRPAEPPVSGATPSMPPDVLASLSPSDLPLRIDDRAAAEIEFFTGRGRDTFRTWLTRAAPMLTTMRETLASEGVPGDLVCVAANESGFDPRIRSRANAVGLWQFVRTTGESYGLTVSHWIDDRQGVRQATRAAAQHLRDLKDRLGSWELALSAYNVGLGGVQRAMRKYNTNDYFALASYEAGLPYETTIYVARIAACSVIVRNLAHFGFAEATFSPTTELEVPPATRLDLVARAAGVDAAIVSNLNAELRRGRTPPASMPYRVLIPANVRERAVRELPRLRGAVREREYVVRFGEGVPEVAARFGLSAGAFARMNDIESSAPLSAGTVVIVPDVEPRDARAAEPPLVAVPTLGLELPGRRQVFYRVVEGDTLSQIAAFFHVTQDELRAWNRVDPAASLARGLIVQIFAPEAADLSSALVLLPSDVRLVEIGSDEFFNAHESERGRERIRHRVAAGESLESIARRYDLSVGSLSRINRFSRTVQLRVGQEIIVYAPRTERETTRTQPNARGTAPARTTASSAPTETSRRDAASPARPQHTPPAGGADRPATTTEIAPAAGETDADAPAQAQPRLTERLPSSETESETVTAREPATRTTPPPP